MAVRGYTSIEAIQDELGVVLNGDQAIHAERLMEEIEADIDLRTGRRWLATSPSTETLRVSGGYVRLANHPILSVTGITVEVDPLTAPETIPSDAYRVVDLAEGVIAIPGYENMIIHVTVTHAGPVVPAAISRAARLYSASALQPVLSGALALGITDDVQSYQIGPALRVSRFDQRSGSSSGSGKSTPKDDRTATADGILRRYQLLLFI